jgi:hypothetical protein
MESTRIILGKERFKGAINVNSAVSVTLDQTSKDLVEYDRSVDLDLEDVFDEERQRSTTFRPTTKFTILFQNALTGSTSYVPFRDNLYYTNEIANTITAFPAGNINPPLPVSSWEGFPQYFEFDFIRTDNFVTGYTQPPNEHLIFKNVSATTYNWNHSISYPYKNEYNKTLYAVEPNTNIAWTWVASQGIPFYIMVGSDQETRFISFKCPIPHGLSVSEYVELTITYNGENYFQVSSLGTTGVGSEDYIFNISNPGYTGTTFLTGVQGTLKRVLNVDNVSDTISEYYVRKHMIITNPKCSVLTNAGFELNIFNSASKYEVAALTPNQQSRSSVKENSKSYTLSFNCDIDINDYRDNQKRPLTQLFFTTIWKGYFGWTRNMKQGWDFNVYLKDLKPQPWWDQSNPLSNTGIQQLQYFSTNNFGPFYYNDTLVSGDTIDGDFCEWSNYEQTERVISEYVHKIKFNQNFFLIKNDLPLTNQFGYFYNPHQPIQIREYSDYIEESESANILDLPDYAYYSQLSNSFRWRDIYPYGFIGVDSNGVDYPFLNGKHYPYVETIFRITPENYNIPSEYTQGFVPPITNTIADPTVDECE